VRILLIDNYDSFTWNLEHLLAAHGSIEVRRNDDVSIAEAASYDGIVLSPGPGLPADAGITMDVIQQLMPTHPMLGVCLGMQAMVESCGGRLFNQPSVRHGVAVPCRVEEPSDPLFKGVPAVFDAGLYHSWAADPSTFPAVLRITARSAEGTIMAVRHASHPACGMQFHPESVLTPMGARLVSNWVESTFHVRRA